MKESARLGEFEQLALLAVMQLGDNAYGAVILEELENRAGRAASISSIYITLTRLEGKGLVRSWLGPPTAVRGGKSRRYFGVTPGGESALRRSRTRLLAMWDGLEGRLDAAAHAE